MNSKVISVFKNHTGFDFTTGEILKLTTNYTSQNKAKKFNLLRPKSRSIADFYIEDHISGNNTYSLKRFKHSKVYVVDIDSGSQCNAYYKNNMNILVDKVIDTLNIKPFFIEKNEYKDNYHLYFKLDTYIYKEGWTNFESHIKTSLGGVIECIPNDGFKTMRLPFSKDYKLISGTYSKQSDNRVKMTLSLEDKLMLFSNAKNTPISKILVKLNGKNIELTKNRNCSTSSKNLPNYFYGIGTRHSAQLKIGIYSVTNNLDFDSFISLCEHFNDGSSKDMMLPIDKRNDMLRKIYEWCTDISRKLNFSKVQDTSDSLVSIYDKPFFKNEDYQMDDTYYKALKEYLENIMFINNFKYYKDLKGKQLKTRKKKTQEFIRNCLHTIEFMLSMKDFRENNEYAYKNKDYDKNLIHGIPFGQNLQRAFSKNFHIPNIRKIMKFLKDYEILETLQSSNGFTFSYKKVKYVKHYKLMNILALKDRTSEFISFFRNLSINSSLSNKIKYNYINHNNTLTTLDKSKFKKEYKSINNKVKTINNKFDSILIKLELITKNLYSSVYLKQFIINYIDILEESYFKFIPLIRPPNL